VSQYKSLVVIKRPKAAKHKKHGGSWKIAYADFMTALMATFLVLWLLSTASPKTKEGIAEHFRMPLKVAISGGQKSSTSTSVIPGGGTDPSHSDGEVKRTEVDAAERDRLEEMKRRLEKMIDANPALRQFRPQLLIDIVADGLRIQIVDSSKRPMFDLSSATVQPYMGVILREIGPVLNELPNKITLSGHTDSTPYARTDKSYSNWELSANRANASRRELIAGGMSDQKVIRVVGVAETMHLNKDNPLDPVNRRISIIVLNRNAQDRIEHENASNPDAHVDNQGSAAGQLRAVTPAPKSGPAASKPPAAKP
jgi:chemotaxis protein MotB